MMGRGWHFDSGRKMTGSSRGNASSISSYRPLEAILRCLDVFLETLGVKKSLKQQSFLKKFLPN